MILTILVAFVSLIALIVLHEFGHFILAKRFGAEVEEFGIGYPPRLFGKKIGQTLYSLNLLPFGAFVSIRGEQGGIEDYRSFTGKPMWQRYSIVLGGVVSFWVVAGIILSIVAGVWGLPKAVSDEDNHNLINPRIQITRILPDSLAKEAGLKIGDVIVGFDKVASFQEFIKANRGREIKLTIKRGKDIWEKKIIIKEDILGVELARVVLKPYSWYQAPIGGIAAVGNLTVNVVRGWILGLKNVFGISELPEGVKMEFMGPLGIFDLLREYFAWGINYFLFLISLIAVALALANILPIPALDGGKIVFLTIEAIRKKPVNRRLEQRITSAFFILLIILMIFITIKFDIPRIF
jgi:regulator of sigma E protease